MEKIAFHLYIAIFPVHIILTILSSNTLYLEEG